MIKQALYLLLGLMQILWSPLALGAPPEVSLGSLPSTAVVGEEFSLSLDIRWEGVDRGLQIVGLDPGAAAPFEVSQAQHSQRREGETVEHRMVTSITPTIPGEALLGPIALLYQEGDSEETYRLELPGTYAISVTSKQGMAARGALLLGSLALVGLAFLFLRRRGSRKEVAPSDVGPIGGDPQAAHREVKRLVGRGEWEGALSEMVQLISSLGGLKGAEELPAVDEVKEEGQRLRYGGGQPNTQKIERWIRALERCLRAQGDKP